jgi:hypothetical protein
MPMSALVSVLLERPPLVQILRCVLHVQLDRTALPRIFPVRLVLLGFSLHQLEQHNVKVALLVRTTLQLEPRMWTIVPFASQTHTLVVVHQAALDVQVILRAKAELHGALVQRGHFWAIMPHARNVQQERSVILWAQQLARNALLENFQQIWEPHQVKPAYLVILVLSHWMEQILALPAQLVDFPIKHQSQAVRFAKLVFIHLSWGPLQMKSAQVVMLDHILWLLLNHALYAQLENSPMSPRSPVVCGVHLDYIPPMEQLFAHHVR